MTRNFNKVVSIIINPPNLQVLRVTIFWWRRLIETSFKMSTSFRIISCCKVVVKLLTIAFANVLDETVLYTIYNIIWLLPLNLSLSILFLVNQKLNYHLLIQEHKARKESVFDFDIFWIAIIELFNLVELQALPFLDIRVLVLWQEVFPVVL
jgi:hypothetical protein